MLKNLLIAGVGGQGTVLAARLAAAAALATGLNVCGSETIGMAQRGGSVTSHVRMSSDELASPLIAHDMADLIIAFEPGEALRALPFLAHDGVLVCADRPVMPAVSGDYDPDAVLAHLRKLPCSCQIITTQDIETCCGIKSLNVALLSYAVGLGLLPFDASALEKELLSTPPLYRDKNNKALLWGLQAATSSNAS